MIRIERRDAILEILIDRAERRNALTDAMYRDIERALREADADPACAAVILHGAGGHFTAGNDLAEFQMPQDSRDVGSIAFLHALASVDVPVIAAVQGQAVGVGVTLLLHCDFVYAAPDAAFRLPFVSLGLCPEGASSLLLPRLAGERRAARWLLGAEPFGAADALAGQVLSAVEDDPLAAARACARSLAAQPGPAVRASKRLLREPGRAEVHRVLDAEAAVFFERLKSPEAQAAFQKFFARTR
ncbi:MAG: enoyl-CoA hydratase-related protein [Castellaniella sp.]|jgi:enoyl-CoA hydratase/carnithine racemase|uniref:enoyl-CoA hydratase-related protein n=2 Tax=Castellaniella sp. TaxID=1955812 RepID=UPI003C725140